MHRQSQAPIDICIMLGSIVTVFAIDVVLLVRLNSIWYYEQKRFQGEAKYLPKTKKNWKRSFSVAREHAKIHGLFRYSLHYIYMKLYHVLMIDLK